MRLCLFLALCCAPVLALGADDPEFTVDLISTWRSQQKTNQHHVTATCIVASNGWFFSGDFSKNARFEYWLVGTNLVERSVITSSMYLEQTKDFVSEKILQKPATPTVAASYPPAGQVTTKIHPSPLGQPVFRGMDGAVWLAFCSAQYLTRDGRQIPMPIGPSSLAFGYSDKTVLLQKSGGLPKTVELLATNGTSVCKYEVLATTNYHGRIFPLQFKVIQLGTPQGGAATSASTSELIGNVISLKPGKAPPLPVEAQSQLPLNPATHNTRLYNP